MDTIAAVRNRILQLCGEREISINKLATICALPPSSIKNILYGKSQNPSVSYMRSEEECERILLGENVLTEGITYAALDIVLNCHAKEENLRRLDALYGRDLIKLMIHEQYFYEHHPAYQKDFEEKLSLAFEELRKREYTSVFFEETI